MDKATGITSDDIVINIINVSDLPVKHDLTEEIKKVTENRFCVKYIKIYSPCLGFMRQHEIMIFDKEYHLLSYASEKRDTKHQNQSYHAYCDIITLCRYSDKGRVPMNWHYDFKKRPIVIAASSIFKMVFING